MKLKPLFYSAASLVMLSLIVCLGIGGSLFTPKVYAQDATQPQLTATAAPQNTAFAAGTERTDSFGIKQVYVPAGCFMMGTSDAQAQNAIAQYVQEGFSQSEGRRLVASEQPQHQVCITKNYWLDEFDVTNAAFDAFVKAGGYSNDVLWSKDGLDWKQSQTITGPNNEAWGGNDCTQHSSAANQPRVCVSYYEAEAYAAWRGARLPTEAEWEYAAHGPNDAIYPWGNTFDQSKANTHESGIGTTTLVDAYPTGRSWVGAYDMAGNVWQWVSDWYVNRYYGDGVKNDPAGPTTGTIRGLRGGSFNRFSNYARSAHRSSFNPNFRSHDFGFRLAVGAVPG